MRPVVATAALTLALALVPAARGGDALFVGASEDGLKWRPAATVAVARDLGVSALRVTVPWSAEQRHVAASDAAELDAAVTAAFGMRVVLAVYGAAREAPLTPAAREDFCVYVAGLLDRYPTVNDVVIWNEPNLSYFWQPQFNDDRTSAAPAAYEALLARCYDVLHAGRPGVNVIGPATSPRGNDRPWAPSNVSHSPANFIRRLGDAYRASGRSRPIADTFGQHVYGHSAERPWKSHPNSTQISQGDLDRLLDALRTAFGGTAQPLPGTCGAGGRCVTVWYLEAGYQTVPPTGKRSGYTGEENDSRALPDAGGADEAGPASADSFAPDQATQLLDGVRLAYCQPEVGAFFNFLLQDEQDLGRWQSGVLWADGTPKASYGALKRAIEDVAARRIDCAKLKGREGGMATKPVASAATVEWPTRLAYTTRDARWSFRVVSARGGRYRAAIVRLPAGRRVLAVEGALRARVPASVVFPARTLARGVYRLELVVARTTIRSNRFVVR